MAYPPQYGGYNQNYGYGGYQPQPGGYSYSAYGVNYCAPPGQYSNYPQYNPMMMNTHMLQQAPPSVQTNMFCNMSFSTDAAFQLSAMKCLRMNPEDFEVSDDEEEEEGEEEEEEVKMEKKKFKKKCKKRQKLAQKVAEQCESDESFLEQVRQNYIEILRAHLVKDGTFEPTEGTIKYYEKYEEGDPVLVTIALDRGKEEKDFVGTEWDSEMDSIYLRNACEGAGTNEDAIIYVCTTRNNAQRQEILQKFKTSYGEDLKEVLDSETSGCFKDVIQALFVPPAEYDAKCCHDGIQGLGTDESVLIEILLTRTNAQIHEMVEAYKELTEGKDLETNIVEDTSGQLKRILVSSCQGNRTELDPEKLDKAVKPALVDGKPIGGFEIDKEELIDMDRAKSDANLLFEAGEDCFGTDEDTFLRIFANREVHQLRETYSEYVKLTQRDLENTINREFSGFEEKALLTLVMAIKCRVKYFAERLKWTMEGLGTKDSDLIRIIVSRSEIDMEQIKDVFVKQNGKTLWRWLKEDCSGDYKKMLQAIVRKNE